MRTRKYKSNGHTFVEVTFLSSEHKDFAYEKPTTHVATVFFDGLYYFLFQIDAKEANSLAYKNARSAVKNGWIIK